MAFFFCIPAHHHSEGSCASSACVDLSTPSTASTVPLLVWILNVVWLFVDCQPPCCVCVLPTWPWSEYSHHELRGICHALMRNFLYLQFLIFFFGICGCSEDNGQCCGNLMT